MKLDFSWPILEKKYSNTKFNENPFSGSGFVAGGRTDRRGEGNSSFCERA
jgi:hypothetical protein